MGALQAQDYAMAKWALGVRLLGTTEDLVENSINKAEIIRTHLMRPTWHLVTAEDVRWMLTLTAPYIKSSVKSMQKKLGLSEALFKQTNSIIEKLLRDNNNLTRTELMAELKERKIPADNLQAIHIMLNAELNGIVCNDPMRGKQFTYALIDDRIPPTKPLTKEESLGKLAKKYFISHGPATIQDFMWWSGLPALDARKGLESVKNTLSNIKIEEETYWFGESSLKKDFKIPALLLLPAYDEFMISYKDRSASLDPKFTALVITENGIFKPIIVVDGRVIGFWSRTIKKGQVIIAPTYFRSTQKLKKKEIEIAAQPFGKFLNLEVVVR